MELGASISNLISLVKNLILSDPILILAVLTTFKFLVIYKHKDLTGINMLIPNILGTVTKNSGPLNYLRKIKLLLISRPLN